ncbi:BASS family bile acid:Na+ symporter [Algoriphagus aquaeductus]|uniref:BASS family bile acid:Na+ symporter n=1 Tax=Algoriphagus aquaeductus TaxID=475299 RepID=A0A326S6W3_9BACT|nr:bile acid:sodium symporter family protein [Algoriphagus aquaeductus]PZV85556.1 BASS family bile acid:Na+ symporter [Algoriphagus aquaeductus]
MFKLILRASPLVFLSWILVWWLNGLEDSGWILVAFWLFLGLGFQAKEELKPFSFPVAILGVVALAMFFPQYFQEVNGFKLTGLINPLIQMIMFGMGATLSWKDFAAVAKSPKSVAIGVLSQFLIMPLVGFGLAKVSGLAPEVAAGIILVGCAPGGTASNVMAFLAKANVALSVTLTSISTLLAPFMMPVLMKVLAGQFIEIDLLKMMWDIFKIILLPVGAGLVINQLLKGKSNVVEKLLPLVSMLGIALIILVITAVGRDALLEIGSILILLVLLHNLLGYGIGYGFSKVIGMSEQDSRTIGIEVGMQNAGLASGLSNILGKIATVGLAPAVFGPIQNVTGSILATFWSRKK